MTPDVAIIIPTKDRPPELKKCIDRLLPQIPSGDSWGVIVIDDGVTPPDLPNSVTWMRGPRRGPGANRNLAALRAEAEWLIFVDDDCLPVPGFLEAYRSAMAAAGPGARVVLVGQTIRGEGPHDSLMWESPLWTGFGHNPPSCNFAIPRALMKESGGFDERFRGTFEDMEFFSRIRLEGADFQFVPTALVMHPMRKIPSATKLAERWHPRVLSTHDLGASALDTLRLLPRHVAAVIVSRFRQPDAKRDRIPAAFRFIGEYLFFILQLPGWIRTIKKTPRSEFWCQVVADGKAPRRFGL